MKPGTVIGCIVAAAVFGGGAMYAVNQVSRQNEGVCQQLVMASNLSEYWNTESIRRQLTRDEQDIWAREAQDVIDAQASMTPAEARDCAASRGVRS